MYPPPPPNVIPIPIAMPVPGVMPQPQPRSRINVRQKGQRGEREVVSLLQGVVSTIRARYSLAPLTLQRNALQAHLGGADLHGLDEFAIEVKFQENTNVPAWWRQTIAQAGGTRVPILFYRGSRQPWTVMMQCYMNTPKDRDQVEMTVTTTLEDFMSWFEEAYDESCVTELQNLK